MAKKQTKNKSSAFQVSRVRKLEIAGILIMAIAVLVAMSIVTYQKGDYALIQSLSMDQLFSVDRGPALRVQNALGVIGAYLSHFFVYTLFGYVSMLVPAIIFLYGWHLFRNKTVQGLLGLAIYVVWSTILLSTILGWLYNRFQWLPVEWNGAAGVALARILQNIMGIGSIVLLGVLFIVTLLMIMDRDLQWSIDGLKLRLADMGDSVANLFRKWGEKRKASSQESVEEEPEPTIKEPDQSFPNQSSSGNQRSEQSNRRQKGSSAGSTGTSSVSAGVNQDGDAPKRDQPAGSQPKKQEKRSSGDEEESAQEKALEEKTDDDMDIQVYVGEGEEEADKKELEKQNRDKSKETPSIKYRFPKVDLLDSGPDADNDVDLEEIKRNKSIILDKLERHNIEIESINAIVGPTVTLYELQPAPDVKISKIESYANDLKMATAAHGLRIIAPIPGRSAVGIEIPNSQRETVYAKSVINTKKFVNTDFMLPVALGKTIENEVFMIDLTKLPHLLIAGATGSGKTVGINNILTCLLYKCHPDNLKFVLIDPKKIELSLYQNIKNHFLATLPDAEESIITDTTKALETLHSLTMEMDERYDLLKKAMVRDIKAYNERFEKGELDEDDDHRHLPYIVVVIDELADLMMTAGKQIEEPITRLAQLARAVGIHLVVATQRPSVNVITGTIKANFPARIAYQVASRVDSRTILDTKGADQLVGNGDMLYTNGGGMTRLQNAFVSTEEVERITEFIGNQQGYGHPYELPVEEEEEADGIPDPLDDKDELFEDAAKLVVMHQQGSVSLLQRKLKLGYNRAGRIIDQLYAAGVVGPYQGSTARDVLCEDQDELEEKLAELDD